MTSYARLTPYEVGQIKAHHAHGMGPVDIAGVVVKTDGAHPTHSAVSQTLSHLGRNGKWRGDRKATTGRPRASTVALDKAVVKEVFKSRGSIRVTVSYLKKKIVAARSLSNSLLERRLAEAGLKWMRRRRKTLVPKEFLLVRRKWAKWVLKKRARSLKRWVYTDGTVFFWTSL